MPTVDPVVARKTWRTVEPLHGVIYFAPESAERYAALGIDDRAGYFASRSAAMGPVGAEVVIATFFNFNPELVRRAVPAVWQTATPDKVLAARLDAADAVLRRVLGDAVVAPEMARAAELARVAAEAACEHLEGRPLFAAHAGLDWPDQAHLVLWHAQTLLREYRGDGHVATLTASGLTGIEAVVVHAATGEVPAEVLKVTRAWSDQQWAAGVDSVRSRGWLAEGDDLRLSEAGAAHRQQVEDTTDQLAVDAYRALGEDGCAELRGLTRPFSQAIVSSGSFGFAAGRD
jgi:helix-turn-helix protein